MAEPAGSSRVRPFGFRFFSAWLPVLLFEALVLFLSSRSNLSLPGAIPNLDKAAHVSEYALLGWLLRRALAVSYPGWRGATAVTILLVALLGAGDELFQSTVPGRDSSPWDWLADFVGGTTGAMVAQWWYRRRAGPFSGGGQSEGTKG